MQARRINSGATRCLDDRRASAEEPANDGGRSFPKSARSAELRSRHRRLQRGGSAVSNAGAVMFAWAAPCFEWAREQCALLRGATLAQRKRPRRFALFADELDIRNVEEQRMTRGECFGAFRSRFLHRPLFALAGHPKTQAQRVFFTRSNHI